MSEFRLNTNMCMQPKALPPSAWVGHIPFAAWLVEELKPRTLVELGTHNGASYLGFCQAVRESMMLTQCFAVDTWQGDEHSGVYGEEVFAALSSIHQENYSAFSQLLRMTFDEANVCFADASVDVLHIDGLHTYEAVKHDFESWLPKISDRGVILFHDTQVRERGFGVWRLWDEVSRRYPSFEFTHAHGLGVLMVGSKVPKAVLALPQLAEGDMVLRVRRVFERLATTIDIREKLAIGDRKTRDLEEAVAGLRQELVAKDAHSRHLDQLIVALEAAVADRELRLPALEALGSNARARLDGQAEDASGFQAKIASLDQALAESKRQIEQLTQVISDRDARLGQLAQIVADNDDRLVHWARVVADKDGQLERMAGVIAAKDAQVQQAAKLERESALQLEKSTQALRDRDARIERMSRQGTEAEARLEQLAQVRAEQDARLAHLERALADREAGLASRDKMLAERRAELVASAGKLAAERELGAARMEEIARLSKACQGLESSLEAQSRAQAEALAALGVERDKVRSLRQSNSWKFTLPMRWLSATLKGQRHE